MNKTKCWFFIFIILSIAIISFAQSAAAAQSAIDLGTAGNFVILAKSGVSTTGTTAITGDIGLSPAAATFITGFGLIADSSNTFSTSSLVTGKIYASDYTPPTPAVMTTAVSDMETAYADASGRTLPDYTELGAGNIGGMTLTPGLYKWGTGVIIPTDVTLSGSSTDVWIFQIAGTLDIASGKKIILSGGAQAKNIFWQVADTTTLETTSVFNGNILDLKEIVLNTGATLNGRALSQTAVTLDANSVSLPAAVSASTTTSSSTSSSSTSANIVVSSPQSNASAAANAGTYGADVTTTPGYGAAVAVTTPRGIISIVSGSSVTITRDGETIEITSVDGLTRLKSQNIVAETELSAETEDKTIRLTQSNGAKAEIKIMPLAASETAIARLKLKVCTEENNCTITLKEAGVGADARLVYQVKAQKNVKVLGLFKAKMNVETNVDAETGAVISSKVPWWSSISVDAS